MDAKLQRKLFKKYPEMFKNRKLSIRDSCMAWGVETGDGWYWLIDNLCEYISKYAEWNSLEPILIDQVKEKFGSLRFYHSGGDENTDGMITFAEHLSNKICENCGTRENVTQNGKGWIKTLCDKCRRSDDKK